MFFGNENTRGSAAQSQRSYQAPSQSNRQAVVRGNEPDPIALVRLFRDKIKARGARGIIGL